MVGNRRILIAGLVLTACGGGALAGRASSELPAADDRPLKAAVDRGLGLLYRAGRNWQKNQSCFSCHHQTLPAFAVVEATAAGIPGDTAWLKSQADFTHAYFQARVEPMKAGKHVPGGASTLGYGLWSLKLDRRPPDETTAAMVGNLLLGQGLARLDSGAPAPGAAAPVSPVRLEGPWLPSCSRPPLTQSRVGATVLALIGLRHYATGEQRPALEKAAAAAEKWLAKAPLRNTEDYFWRLWGLHQFAGDPAVKEQVRRTITAALREDGGWAQEAGMASDAYATGEMLFVLRETGTTRDDPVARRAVAYLQRTQHEDGSWLVESRLKSKAQPYFDNGDPYGEHQFLSVAATAWATTACARMLPSPGDGGG